MSTEWAPSEHILSTAWAPSKHSLSTVWAPSEHRMSTGWAAYSLSAVDISGPRLISWRRDLALLGFLIHAPTSDWVTFLRELEITPRKINLVKLTIL